MRCRIRASLTPFLALVQIGQCFSQKSGFIHSLRMNMYVGMKLPPQYDPAWGILARDHCDSDSGKNIATNDTLNTNDEANFQRAAVGWSNTESAFTPFVLFAAVLFLQ
jgi:hypothetical protein